MGNKRKEEDATQDENGTEKKNNIIFNKQRKLGVCLFAVYNKTFPKFHLL